MIDAILFNGRVATLDPAHPPATAVAIEAGLFAAVGNDREIHGPARAGDHRCRSTWTNHDPGLKDSHTHVIGGGLTYNRDAWTAGARGCVDAPLPCRSIAD